MVIHILCIEFARIKWKRFHHSSNTRTPMLSYYRNKCNGLPSTAYVLSVLHCDIPLFLLCNYGILILSPFCDGLVGQCIITLQIIHNRKVGTLQEWGPLHFFLRATQITSHMLILDVMVRILLSKHVPTYCQFISSVEANSVPPTKTSMT